MCITDHAACKPVCKPLQFTVFQRLLMAKHTAAATEEAMTKRKADLAHAAAKRLEAVQALAAEMEAAAKPTPDVD